MENGLVSPLGLVVIKIVLGEAAGIHDAEMRVDTWPLVRRGFAAIIETGPGKSAGQPRTLGINGPPIFSELRPGRNVRVIGADKTCLFIVLIHTTCAYGASSFSADRRSPGKLTMKCVHGLSAVVIEARPVNDCGQACTPIFVHGFGDGTS